MTYERNIMNLMKKIGFTDCKTSRYASKEADDNKIDLVNTGPLVIQCKSVNSSINYWGYFKKYPHINTVFHKRKYYLGKQSELVIMTRGVFEELIETYIMKGEKGDV